MKDKDIQWLQRFSNYGKAFEQLEDAVNLAKQRELSELERQGLIQGFEYTYELAWNTIKDFYENQGEMGIQDSRDAIRMAFKRGLISDGDSWMAMIKSRTLASHTYDEKSVKAVVDDIINCYYDEFMKLKKTLGQLKEQD
ncbi:MAG: nucleotidyltransferase substrate binding protein [Anaerohalosphaeraceae bacterium]|nr:nucleotidyltransferase substrate binding protein [Anaerohalosphaeraceae bacterium]